MAFTSGSGNSRAEHGPQGRKVRIERTGNKNGAPRMGRIIKALFLLAILGFLGLTGYAYLADLSPDQAEVKVPVTLNAD